MDKVHLRLIKMNIINFSCTKKYQVAYEIWLNYLEKNVRGTKNDCAKFDHELFLVKQNISNVVPFNSDQGRSQDKYES